MSATELLEPVLKGGIRSINFFNGRLLSAEDLSDEQAANRQGRALLGQAVGEGVAYGFEVAKGTPGPNQDAVVTVSPGLAINRLGQTLRLPAQTDVALSRSSVSGTTASAATFKPCVELQGGVFITEAGVYLLTVAPADGREGRAQQTSGLGNTGAPCAARYTVEGVLFRLVQVLKSNELGDLTTLRNRVAYDCFGAETLRQYEAAPFGQPPRTYGLLDALRPNTLTDSDVPLALVYWTKQKGVEFIDMWSARRRPVRPSSTERWGALAADRRVAETEAMMLQFQEQVAALQGGQGLGNLRAEDHFLYLPPAGLLPVGTGAFNWQTFLGPHAPPEALNLDEGLLRSILARSVCVDPVKISTLTSSQAAGQSPPVPVLVYRVPGASDFVLFARSTRGRLRVFLGAANSNVPPAQIYAIPARNSTQHYSSGGTGGIYSIDRLDAGTYNVTVYANNFPTTPVAAVVTNGRTTDVTFTAGAPGSILVTVRDKATGASIGNKVLTVTATPPGGSPAQGAPAAGDKWQVPNLTAGPYAVAVTATGYTSPAPQTIAVAAGQAAALTIELVAIPVNDAIMNLQVSDRTTSARIDQTVETVKATNAATGAVRIGVKGGAGGLWSITQLAAGTYNVEVTAANYQKETVTGVALTASQVKTVTVQMTATPGSVALTVTNASTGANIDDKVTGVSATLGTQPPVNGTKVGGKWSIPNLAPGTYSVTVTATDFTTKTQTGVAVTAGQTNQLAVAMQPVVVPPGTVNLTVTDETTGANIDDKVTGVSATSGTLTSPGTKTAGKWSITNLPPATYSVLVEATNYNSKTTPGVVVTSGTAKAVTVALQPLPGSINLTATDSATNANIDSKVTGFNATNPQGQTFTGSKVGGKWSITNVPPGTYSVAVLATNYTTKTQTGVAVTAGTAKAITVSLVAVPGSINLDVNVSGSNSAIDDRVTGLSATNGQQTFNGTKVGGKWSIPNLAPGTYSVTVTADRYVTKTTQGVVVTSATATALTVTLNANRSQPSAFFNFTRGDLDHQHTEYSHHITPNSFPTPPTGTLANTDSETDDWFADWREYVYLTRPEKGIDETKKPQVKVTSTSRHDNIVDQDGFIIFFRADNTRVAMPWDRSVETVFPGTDPV